MELIELRSNNGNQISNAEYECIFTPRTINNQDSIFLKTAMLDTYVQNSAGQLYIKDDLELSISFCFYDYDHDLYPSIQAVKKYNYPMVQPIYEYMIGNTVGTNEIFVKTVNINLSNGVYTPDSLAQEITRLLTSINEDEYPNYINTGNSPFCCPPTSFGTYQDPDGNRRSNLKFSYLNKQTGFIDYRIGYNYYTDRDNELIYPIPLLGAQQLSLTYNNNNNNRFQWDYCHTPPFNPYTNPPDLKPVSAFWFANVPEIPDPNNPQNPLWYGGYIGQKFVKTTGGILFVDLQPRSFFQGLGFNLDEICLKLSPNKQQILNYNFDKQFTYQFTSIADLFDRNENVLFDVNDGMRNPIFKFSDSTNPIKARQFVNNDPSPYYLLEITTNYSPSDYQDGSSISKQIQAICGKGYISSNYIIVYSDDGLVYTHNSDIPIVISSAKVRILDANNKEPSDNIGPNNYVILGIQRAPQQSQIKK